MRIFFLRHGRREFVMGDVPLNPEGLGQAEALGQHAKLGEVRSILSSPKTRAFMTVEPLAQTRALPIEVVPELDQMGMGESGSDFSDRVNGVIQKLASAHWPAPLILCSHSDWLAIALRLIPCDELDMAAYHFDCGQFIEFEITDGLWQIRSIEKTQALN